MHTQQNKGFRSYTYITLGLTDLSSITIILPSGVQNMLKQYSSLASFNFVIRKEVKLSVTDILIPLNFILLMKTFFLIFVSDKRYYYCSTFLT